MIDVQQALATLAEHASRCGQETVDLAQAIGRILAETVRADRDFPPTDRSAMDGFAVRVADVGSQGGTLELIGEVRAGQLEAMKLGQGQAARIMTGGIVPRGADAVVMLEDIDEDEAAQQVTLAARPEAGQHIRRRGEEQKAGRTVLEPGVAIHAAEVAAMTSVGHTRVRVTRPPVVHVLATGDEIVEPDDLPGPHQVRNSNAHTLLGQLRELGVEGHYDGIANDDRQYLERKLEQGLSGDLLLVTGGVSVGRYDLVGEALAKAGVELLFHKVAVKPGKPMLAGKRGGCLVVGLPGNPVSAYTGFAVFVAPTLRRAMGYRRFANVEVAATLGEPLRNRPGRETFHLARVESESGSLVVRPAGSCGSGDVLALSRANAFMHTAADCEGLDAGVTVPTLLWREFGQR